MFTHDSIMKWNKTRNVGWCLRDGCLAEYSPLFNAAKFGWRPILEWRAVMLQRRETRWNLQGCPKLTKQSQPLVCQSSPYCGDMWRRYCCLTSFFFNCKDIAQQSCAMVPRWQFFMSFCVLYFQRAACSTFQTCILNLHWGHTMCGSMADIQSATAEIRWGNKKDRKN